MLCGLVGACVGSAVGSTVGAGVGSGEGAPSRVLSTNLFFFAKCIPSWPPSPEIRTARAKFLYFSFGFQLERTETARDLAKNPAVIEDTYTAVGTMRQLHNASRIIGGTRAGSIRTDC